MSSRRSASAGQLERPEVDAREQVVAEPALAHRRRQIAVRAGDELEVAATPRGRAPSGRKRFSSSARSSIACSSSAELADLVEEQHAAFGAAAAAPGDRAARR